MSELRPYQVTAIDSALAALSNSGSAVLQMPTGAGKTRAATEIVRNEPGTVWFICHRVEIAQQAAKAFRAAGIDFGMISPRAIDPETGKKYHFKPAKRVQIIMVGSLARRMADLPAPSLVIWDECHHVAAKSWAAIREQLSDTKHLGLTATPERLDGKGLAEWFAVLVTGPTIESLITDEWLSPFRYFAPSDPDLSAAKMQAGDYDKKDLARIMNAPVLIGDAVAEYRRAADGKRAIAFCASVDASRALVERFNAEGVPALHVDGDTAPEARGEAVKALAAGNIKVLSNVEVFTEGFDVPGIEAVILMRPTKSPTLLLQMIGRALRFVEGKTAIIMDHAGLWQDHGWFADDWHWSIDGGAAKARRRAGMRGPRRCPECKKVRAERVPVCEACGFEFPSGREIGEYDGVLTEVRGAVPEGYAIPEHWARRNKLGSSTVSRWVKSGKLQLADNGFLDVLQADSWLVAGGPGGKYAAIRPPTDVSDPSAYVSVPVIAELLRVREGTVRAWIKEAPIPVAKNGWVRLLDFLIWHRDSPNIRSGNIKVEEDYISKNECMRRLGYAAGSSSSYNEFFGMVVCDDRGKVSWKDASEKHKVYQLAKQSARRPPVGMAKIEDFETGVAFAQRLNVSLATVGGWKRHRRNPIPKAKNGWIPIQRGLEWVRDNTNTKIPPEAWPSANDNPPPAAEAA